MRWGEVWNKGLELSFFSLVSVLRHTREGKQVGRAEFDFFLPEKLLFVSSYPLLRWVDLDEEPGKLYLECRVLADLSRVTVDHSPGLYTPHVPKFRAPRDKPCDVRRKMTYLGKLYVRTYIAGLKIVAW